MQGLAVGSKYLYTVKIGGSDSKAVLFKTNKDTKATTQLKNTDGKKVISYLGHANDMDVTTLDGKSHLFVATMKTGSKAVVVLKVSGSTFTKVGQFKVTLNGKEKSVSGIAIWSKTATTIKLLFKVGRNFYQGSIGINQRSGTIAIKKAFTINIASVKINGKTCDLSSWTHQGFGLEGNKIFVPLANIKNNKRQSVIVVYDISNPSGTLKSKSDLSFRITSSAYTFFEIESCGISSDKKLYFNINRRKNSKSSDAVCVFKNYKFA
jgi:hypothetical protein